MSFQAGHQKQVPPNTDKNNLKPNNRNINKFTVVVLVVMGVCVLKATLVFIFGQNLRLGILLGFNITFSK